MQLAALYAGRQRVYATFHQVHMKMAFNALGEALAVLITLDELINQNPSLGAAFGTFKRCGISGFMFTHRVFTKRIGF
jgi:hypothetical protein